MVKSKSPLNRAAGRGTVARATRALPLTAAGNAAAALARQVADLSVPVARTRRGQARARIASAASSTSTLTWGQERLVSSILEHPVDFMDSPEFRKRGAEKRIFKDSPDVRRPDVSWYRPLMNDFTSPRSRPPQPAARAKSIILTAAEERVLFLQLNFARFKLAAIQSKLAKRPPTEKMKCDVLKYYRIAIATREQIAETNLALVLAMAKRTRMREVDFGDLISEGNMALMRSVDKFDCGRGFKFSTYACRAILKAFSRQGMKLSRYRQRFPAEFDPALEQSDYLETLREQHNKERADEVRDIVLQNDAELSDIERKVIDHRFGVGSSPDSTPRRTLTLEQVGQIIGVTKERVRQIQNKALIKIRQTMETIEADPLPDFRRN